MDLVQLCKVGIVTFSKTDESWKYCAHSEYKIEIEQAIDSMELNFVRERAWNEDLLAARKLQTIDALAEMISTARADIQS
ncbi:hypothetical protein OAO01_06550 [Oligoflexia bacterium]|nr:hypothetical protein [Oligoflexia bacterium]